MLPGMAPRTLGIVWGIFGCVGCARAAPSVEPEVTAPADPVVSESGDEEISTPTASGSGRRQPEPVDATSGQPPAPAPVITGVASCDQYIALYHRCEPILEPQIMAGDLRPAKAEQGWVEHLMTTPEKEAMPEACAQMLAELRPQCPTPEPEPAAAKP